MTWSHGQGSRYATGAARRSAAAPQPGAPELKNVTQASRDRIGFGLERTLLNRGARFEHDLVYLSKREAGNLDRS